MTKQRSANGKRRTANLDWHLPLIGVLAFLLWTTNRRRTKSNFDLSGSDDIETMIPTLVSLSEGAVDRGNRVEILQNGEFFERLLDDIARAKQCVHVESYIWWTGEICERVAHGLADAARRGVEVRLMVDYSGSSRMKNELRELMCDAGCAVRRFRPLRVSNIGRMNLRTHRKIAVIDGRIGYVGGHGIAEQWTGDGQDKDHWRDTAIRAEGPLATTLQGVFCENWIEESGEVPAGEKYFPKVDSKGKTDAHVAYASPRGSLSTVQLLYYLAINAARRELLIQNPYFLPHEDAIDSLMEAVKRGVDVQIMVPSAKVIDSALVQHASHHHFGDLLKNGVRIFEHQKTLTHQKIMIVDETWSCVGSTNFDDRSFELNDEVTVGLIDKNIAKQLREAYLRDTHNCRELRFDEWRGRPWRHKLLDGLCYATRREL
jgi:cardiolipin synthase A/B